MMVRLFCGIRHIIDKLHCRFEIRKAEDSLDRLSVSLPAVQGTKCLLDFRVSKHSHKNTFLTRCDSSWFGEKFQPCVGPAGEKTDNEETGRSEASMKKR